MPFRRQSRIWPKKLKPTDGWADAAEAIRTTDTFAKSVTRTAMIDGVKVTINGFAKGSGMIAPDMATMLAFLFTDAAISAKVLQKIVDRAVKRSFNSITVDSDTSTSDTVLFAATGAAGNHPVDHAGDKKLKEFRNAVEDAMVELAQLIVRDGEGASKFVTVRVKGAASGGAARRVGLAIANSPLVKTAIAGEDANWGAHRRAWRWARPARRPTATGSASADRGRRADHAPWPDRRGLRRDAGRATHDRQQYRHRG